MSDSASRVFAVLVLLAAPCAAVSALGDDDVAPAAVARERVAAPVGGLDLAAHVDVNVVLPPNQWRVGGDARNLQIMIMAGDGRPVVDGNLTISGEPIPAAPERIRRTDETLMIQLRRVQQDRLAAVAADPLVPVECRRALELATESDIRRVMGEVARLREDYAGRRANLGDETWHRFHKDVQLCRRAITNPFGEDSLFAAVQAGFEPAR